MLVAAVAGVAGYLSNWVKPKSALLDQAAQALILTPFVDVSGKPQTLAQWKDKVLVVNFWATWCAPCREEIPVLMNAEKKHAAKAVKLVGIGIDDAAKIEKFATELNMSYALLIGSTEALNLTSKLGNRAGVLPYTVVLDRSGKVAYTHAGALTEGALDAALAPLL